MKLIFPSELILLLVKFHIEVVHRWLRGKRRHMHGSNPTLLNILCAFISMCRLGVEVMFRIMLPHSWQTLSDDVLTCFPRF